MTKDQLIRYLESQMLLQIWDPSRWDWYPDARKQRQFKLQYRARGIVLHDRALNGEQNRILTS